MRNVSKILAQEGLIGKTAAGRELGTYIHMWCDSIFEAMKSKLDTSKFAKPKKYYSGHSTWEAGMINTSFLLSALQAKNSRTTSPTN